MVSSTNKVAVVGAGSVGSAIAFSLLHREFVGQITLVDTDKNLCRAQVQDLSDAAFLSDTRLRDGSLKEAGQCDIIVMTAGAHRKPGESRLDLLGRNLETLKSAIAAMQPIGDESILIIVTNPVDVLTSVARSISGLPPHQVIGTGTFLDTLRLRHILSQALQVAETAVHAYVIGEHGDSQVVAWSAGTVGGTSLQDLLPLSQISRDTIASATREKAGQIAKFKGATAFGIAAVVSSICETILLDKHHIRPVSHWQQQYGCSLSMPAVLGRQGILSTIPLALSTEEKALLNSSAEELRAVLEELS